MYKFVTHQGSYTLVLKPQDSKIIYDHKGAPVRMEGTQYIEFHNIRGTQVGQYTTEDEAIAEALRRHKRYGTAFTEITDKNYMPEHAIPENVSVVKLPKAALMACRKEELIEIAKKYKMELAIEEETKKSLVDKILIAQVSAEDLSGIPQREAGPGEIKVIRQGVAA